MWLQYVRWAQSCQRGGEGVARHPAAPGEKWGFHFQHNRETKKDDVGDESDGTEFPLKKKKKSSLAWEWRRDGGGARVRPGPPAGLHQRPEQKLMTAWGRALAAETEKMAFWRVNQQALLGHQKEEDRRMICRAWTWNRRVDGGVTCWDDEDRYPKHRHRLKCKSVCGEKQ